MAKKCYGMYADGNEVVVVENEIVGAGKGDEHTTAWGRKVRTSLRQIREVARFPRTAKGERQARELCIGAAQ